MTHSEFEAAVHSALGATLKRALGVNPPPYFDGATKPIGDLGLDSMDGVGFLCDLESFGIKLADDLNPFVDDAKHCARSIEEIIKFVEAHVQIEEAAT